MIEGLRVGHATDRRAGTGATAFVPDEPAVAAVHVSGGAPATRETDLLRPENTVERVDAIVLSGGSAFGLTAADGVTDWLADRGRGFAVGPARIPIVPAAALFDLQNGGEKPASPAALHELYRTLGAAACDVAADVEASGSIGAGAGATTADLKGGFGTAGLRLPGAAIISFVAVNAVGRVTLGATPYFRAAPFEQEQEFGGLGFPAEMPPDVADFVTKRPLEPQASTTLAVVATDVALNRSELKRLAIAAHDGIALAVFPAHTPFDGDTVFALSTGRRPLADRSRGLAALCAGAASTLARAIGVGVHAATPSPGDRFPTWRERYSR